MRGDLVRAEQFAQMMRHALGHAARVDENQSGPVRLDQPCKPTIDFLPHLIRHYRFERRTRQLNRQIQFAAMADVDDFAIRNAGVVHCMSADKKSRYFLDWFLRCR